MPHFDVYYMRPEYFRDGILGHDWLAKQRKLPRPGALGETHVYLAMREAADLENLFREMQAEQWSPCGEARALIEKQGLSHTSMSVGDVAVDEQGRVWLVDVMGWHNLTSKTLESDGEWARRQCAARGVRYLSHETYTTATSHEIWIAVEDGSGRYELKLSRTFA